MKLFVGIAIIILTNFSGLGQEINWITFDELPKKMREEPKQVMIFFYADWCKFCKMQEATTFSDKFIVEQFNKKLYCIKFNGENKKVVKFLGKVYKYKATGVNTGTHELAEFLATDKGKVSYPTTVILSSKFQLINKLVGFQPVEDLK